MVKTKTAKKKIAKRKAFKEVDSVYFLKLVFYLILGSFWVRIMYHGHQIPLPVGLVVGLFFTSRDRFQIDRKIEYAILLVAMFIGFWLPLGLNIVM
jgi:hypothetical protein